MFIYVQNKTKQKYIIINQKQTKIELMTTNASSNTNTSVKNIAILSTKGGGNRHVGEACASALKTKFPNAKIIHQHEGDKLMPGIGSTGVKLYNWLMAYGWFRTIKILTWMGEQFLPLGNSSRKRLCAEWIQKQHNEHGTIDLIVSVTPMINGPLLAAAHKREIPVMIVAADFNNRLYCKGINPDHHGHRYVIPFMTQEVINSLDRRLNIHKIYPAGYPVRPEFHKVYSTDKKVEFRNELHIDQQQPVIPIMMGASGSNSLHTYAKKIIQCYDKKLIKTKAHYVLFCGRSTNSINQLSTLFKKNDFTEDKHGIFYKDELRFSVLGFTKEVYKYLAISDGMITKPGPASISEALCQKVPLLVDMHAGAIEWEKLNKDHVEQHGFGHAIMNLNALPKLLNEVLNPEENAKMRCCIDAFRNNHPEFSKTTETLGTVAKELITPIYTKTHEKLTQIVPKGKSFSRHLMELTTKIMSVIGAIFYLPIDMMFRPIVRRSFFSSFHTNKTLMKKRRRELIVNRNALPIESVFSPKSNRMIDALLLKSTSNTPTGNVVIYVLSKHYQTFHPNNFEPLQKLGADIVLFNPTKNTMVTMQEDLIALVAHLRQKNPNQKIMLNGHSIGGHVALSAACELQDKGHNDISVLADRGYADGYALSKNITFGISRVMKTYIKTHFDLNPTKKLPHFKGEILFTSPEQGKDFMTHSSKINLIKDAYNAYNQGLKETQHNHYIRMEKATHWSSWDTSTEARIHQYMRKLKILNDNTT